MLILIIAVVMIIIFATIFAVQYKLASMEGKPDTGKILESSIIWSIISYIVIGIIVFGISFIVSFLS
ncbi:MAG TPA: hypothetical protein ENK22_00340 [Persephonella sp.]|nr:hypothetical protein [Persephonella sp.]